MRMRGGSAASPAPLLPWPEVVHFVRRRDASDGAAPAGAVAAGPAAPAWPSLLSAVLLSTTGGVQTASADVPSGSVTMRATTDLNPTAASFAAACGCNAAASETHRSHQRSACNAVSCGCMHMEHTERHCCIATAA
jgi:hypothetical protein